MPYQVRPKRGLIQIFHDGIDSTANPGVIGVMRLGISLYMGYCGTDYFSQGISFKRDAYFLHLVASGKLTAGNFRVPLTRPSCIEDVRILAPLWTNDAEKESMIRRVMTAFQVVPSLVADMDRLQALHQATLAKENGTVPRPPAPPPPLPST